jgi:hypothetical protein
MPKTDCAPRIRLLGWGLDTVMDDESLVLGIIGRSHETWLAAAAIASEAGLPLERVLAALDASPAVIVEAALPASDPPAAHPRYSTRAHYRARTGLLRRYVDALLSS